MSETLRVYDDYVTHTVGATAVVGGMVVEYSNDPASTHVGAVVPAAASSLKVAGVSMADGLPLQLVDVSAHGFFRLTAAAALTAGQSVKAAANGQVQPWASGSDTADTRIGVACAAIAQGAVGIVRLVIS